MATSENIEGWRVNSEFYLHEIALLMLGRDPGNYSKDDLLKNVVAGFWPLYKLILNEACSYVDTYESEEYPGKYYKSYELMTNNKPEHMEFISPEDGFQLKASKEYIFEWIKRRRSGGNLLPDKFFTVTSLDADSEHKVNAVKPLFNEEDPKYPIELDIAVKAWQAVVSQSHGKGKAKAQIRAWLDANTKLSNAAKERIEIVANWDKQGGATRTE